MPVRKIQWRRLDGPGSETCELRYGTVDGELVEPGLRGTAAGILDGRPFALAYEIGCTEDWLPKKVSLKVDLAGSSRRAELALDDGRWTRDGEELEELEGCLDLDLAFTPASNTLTLRRLGLQKGDLAAVRAAWVSFPDLEVRPLAQRYARIRPDRYRFESGSESKDPFRTTLTVGADGFVVDFPGFWRATAD